MFVFDPYDAGIFVEGPEAELVAALPDEAAGPA